MENRRDTARTGDPEPELTLFADFNGIEFEELIDFYQHEQIKAFRDTWELGIHSYLSYLRDRLVAARELLAESGSILVQIGDENVHLVRCLLDEVFGAEDLVSQVAFKKTTGAGSPAISTSAIPAVFDSLIWYAKDRTMLKPRSLYREKESGGLVASQYVWAETVDGSRIPLANHQSIPEEARVFAHDNLTSQSGVEKTIYPVEFNGRTFLPAKGVWKTGQSGMVKLLQVNRLMCVGNTLRYVRFFSDQMKVKKAMKPCSNPCQKPATLPAASGVPTN